MERHYNEEEEVAAHGELPLDVVEFIASLVCDRRTLYAFSLVCWTFNRRYAAMGKPRSLATPWCSVCDDAPGLYKFDACIGDGRCKNWIRWVRHQVTVPQLQQVKRLCATCCEFTCDFCGQSSCGCSFHPRTCHMCGETACSKCYREPLGPTTESFCSLCRGVYVCDWENRVVVLQHVTPK